MRSRRHILMGFSAGVAATVLPRSVQAGKDIDDCQCHADNLAASLKAQYGGEWAVNIKPEYGFAVIVKGS